MSQAVAASISKAANALRQAEALLVTAGAGIGVDSGLPDFRGVEGLWRAYPPLGKRRLGFSDMASPDWFESDPNFAWGFYGHRLNLYRSTVPHAGFAQLLSWGRNCKHGVSVFTSNVDGQFQVAGFPEVCECHGSIHWLQTLHGDRVWPADGVSIPEVDPNVLTVPDDALPRCTQTGELARPNILMFGDWGWNGSRTSEQHHALRKWLSAVDPRSLVVVELGAGLAVPSVRHFSENQAGRGATLIRINPRDHQVPKSAISIPLNAAEALDQIDKQLTQS